MRAILLFFSLGLVTVLSAPTGFALPTAGEVAENPCNSDPWAACIDRHCHIHDGATECVVHFCVIYSSQPIDGIKCYGACTFDETSHLVCHP